MTKPAVPPPTGDGARHRGVERVVEIDAMDVAEWESGQRTPQASDANLAELVRKSAAPPDAARAQTVPRERPRTQLGALAIPRPPNRARTEPPGPPPRPARDPVAASDPGAAKPERAQTAGASAPAPLARATRIPDIPVAPAELPRLTPARGGIDFSLPVTSTGDASGPVGAAAPHGKPTVGRRASTGTDFSLPVTATSPAPTAGRRASTGSEFSLPVTATSPAAPAEATGLRSVPPASTSFSSQVPTVSMRPPSEPPRPRTEARPGSEPPRPATASSESGARPPHVEPAPAPPRSLFAEPSRVGPGHNAAPAGGGEPNTAWPPRPVPVDPAVPSSPRRAARQPWPQPAPSPDRDDADDAADRLKVGLPHRRLWWIGGGLAGLSLVAILVAIRIPDPEAVPAPATATQVAEPTSGPRRDPRGAPPVDRAAADLRERVRLAREAAAAGVPMTAPVEAAAGEHRSGPSAAADTEAAAARHAGKPSTHKVIVDYSVRPNEPPPPGLVAQSEEDPAIGMARTAYTTGNQRLFVGDVEGAVRAYREALDLYPGYVGGYRGLGLAYEELGDTASALTALRAYVAAVPTARDIALIKKRIAHLQHH